MLNKRRGRQKNRFEGTEEKEAWLLQVRKISVVGAQRQEDWHKMRLGLGRKALKDSVFILR